MLEMEKTDASRYVRVGITTTYLKALQVYREEDRKGIQWFLVYGGQIFCKY